MSYLQHLHSNGVKNGNTDTLTIPWPAGTQAGDGALIWWVGFSGTTWNAPTGVTFAERSSTDHNGSIRGRVYSRVADGSETGNITLTAGAFNRMIAGLVVYRHTNTVDPIDELQVRPENMTTTSHANPSITPSINGVTLLSLIGERQGSATSSWTPPANYTERVDVAEVGSGGTALGMADDGLGVTYRPGVAYQPGPWVSGNAFASANVIIVAIALAPSIEQPIAKPRLVAQAVARSANW